MIDIEKVLSLNEFLNIAEEKLAIIRNITNKIDTSLVSYIGGLNEPSPEEKCDNKKQAKFPVSRFTDIVQKLDYIIGESSNNLECISKIMS